MTIKKNSKIYVLHEYGAPSHYEGLTYLCKSNSIELVFHEFSWIRQLLSSLKRGNSSRFLGAVKNFFFIISLLLTKRKVIILGIAPFDYRMIFFSQLARKHSIYYHTSWPYWSGKNYPKHFLHNFMHRSIMNSWRDFLEFRCKGVFTVSNFTRDQILSNYKVVVPVTAVYHSIHSSFSKSSETKNLGGPLKLLFVGRLVNHKGINEILQLTTVYEENTIEVGIVGEGLLSEKVIQSSKVKYYGKLSTDKLQEIYRDYDVLLCPSKREFGVWEEAFGLSVIEGMSFGLIPLASNHIGPTEILEGTTLSFLLNDQDLFNDMCSAIDSLLNMGQEELLKLKSEAIRRSKDFEAIAIADLWNKQLRIKSEEGVNE